jgi:hypothetical protein
MIINLTGENTIEKFNFNLELFIIPYNIALLKKEYKKIKVAVSVNFI